MNRVVLVTGERGIGKTHLCQQVAEQAGRGGYGCAGGVCRLLARGTSRCLLIVDELGPLELELGQGLVAALAVLNEGAFSLALVVVRPELLDTLREQLQCA